MSVQFQYDHNGLRTRKTVTENGVTTVTDYSLHGKLITHMTQGTNNLHFFYDAQSRPAKVEFNGTMYTYLHNLQGDIVGIVDNEGALVVEYKYDAWGKPTSTWTLTAEYQALAVCNPFRYRGYVYDGETGLYYLQTRYYGAVQCRFLNADAVVASGILLCNSFAYCSNNAPRRVDASGNAWYDSIVNAWSNVTDFVKECLQAQTEANIRSAQQALYAADKVIWGIGNAWESIKNNVSDWWENKVTPWLNHAKEAIAVFWNETKTFIKHAVQARQQADIISTQMTYNAACIIGNWFSENWKAVADWGTAIAGAGATAYGIVQTVLPALPAIPFVGQIALLGAGIWGIGRLAGWF